MLCALVIGLPLFLLIGPFLNHKMNFTRIKPILDQFQRCYKDKYCSFAAYMYYMICCLVIIVIIFLIPSSNNLSQFLLIFSCSAVAFIPTVCYSNLIFILQLVVLAALVPLLSDVNQQPSTATILIAMVTIDLLHCSRIDCTQRNH